ncbi:unnamed protein product [Dovyalis caffra]|uniref:Terpene synthase N-terminal domain-containing protein n=1 Tax=Dovyalis caffra TaxID=77055 RepID=A0AAV1RRY9_9ROSI|nr:unnamed protein product [Dovyalis caffra]
MFRSLRIPLVKYSSTNNRLSAFHVRCELPSKTAAQTVHRRAEITFQNRFQEYDLVESVRSKYVGSPYTEQANKLKAEVRMMLKKASTPLDQLELVDTLGRLGLAYLFNDEIKSILKSLFHYNNHIEDTKPEEDLYATALEFRILRQHGYNVSAEVFNRFKDEKGGNFWPHLSDDVEGLLYLYEASYFSVQGESTLDDARGFTTKSLEKYVKQCNSTEYLSKLVSHALETPLAWRLPKMEASWFIYTYQSKDDKKPILLELAKLDFNMVQAIYQKDVKHAFK